VVKKVKGEERRVKGRSGGGPFSFLPSPFSLLLSPLPKEGSWTGFF